MYKTIKLIDLRDACKSTLPPLLVLICCRIHALSAESSRKYEFTVKVVYVFFNSFIWEPFSWNLKHLSINDENWRVSGGVMDHLSSHNNFFINCLYQLYGEEKTVISTIHFWIIYASKSIVKPIIAIYTCRGEKSPSDYKTMTTYQKEMPYKRELATFSHWETSEFIYLYHQPYHFLGKKPLLRW